MWFEINSGISRATGLKKVLWGVIFTTMIFFILLLLAMPFSASAYLDPGTMSMIVHAIVGGIVGAVYTIRVFWSTLKNFFKNLFSGFRKNEETQE